MSVMVSFRSVLPVQCLCEFLSAGGGGEAGKAGELCAHLRRTVTEAEEGARAVLHYYLQRLAHAHAPTRASAGRVPTHSTHTNKQHRTYKQHNTYKQHDTYKTIIHIQKHRTYKQHYQY